MEQLNPVWENVKRVIWHSLAAAPLLIGIARHPLSAWGQFQCYGLLYSLYVPGFMYNTYHQYKNRCLPENSEKAIALIAEQPVLEGQSIMIGLKGRIAQFFTKRGVRVDYKHGATIKDFQDALRNGDYKHIVLRGHGSRESWRCSDGVVSTGDVLAWMESFHFKPGYFIQLTCGDKEGLSLGWPVVTDSSKILGFTESIAFRAQWRTFTSNPAKPGLENLENIVDEKDK